MSNCTNPLSANSDNPLDSIYQVCSILAFLEDQASAIEELQVHIPGSSLELSPRGVGGQVALYALLRETLDQSMALMQHR